MPRFEVKQFVIQPTETEDPNSMNMFIQIVPECIGDAHVQDCRGRLLRVYKRKTEQEEWQLTQMDAPLFLGWDYYGHGPFALEPGVRQRLNVCWWSDKINSIIPAVEPLPSKFRVVFGSGGMFKFDIRLSAKDCSPVDVSLMVSRDGRQWNDPIVQFMP